MKHALKLLAIIVLVFLAGYFLESAMDDLGVAPLVENTVEIISELFSVFVALSIFSITWTGYEKSKDNHSLFLGSTFFIVGILILFHGLSYPFMPQFITPNSLHKAAYFFAESRLVLAVLFLASVYVHRDTLPELINKQVTAYFTIILSIIFLVFTLFYHDSVFLGFMPEYIHSTGTIFSLTMITGMILYASYLYAGRANDTGENNLIFLVDGSIIVAFSNLVYFSYEFSAHFLIITGFYFIYIALYKSSVELPYEKLALAEEKLHLAAEEKYRNLFDNANDAIITVDLENRITSWNKTAERLFGWKAEEVTGKKLSPLVVPENLRAERRQMVRNVPEGGTLSGIETVRMRKDGTDVDVSLTISPLMGVNHNVIGFSGIFRDFTERKRGEKRLSKLNECFLGFGTKPMENINRLTALCGELMGATAAFYNRLDHGMLCSWGQWNTPAGYNPVNNPAGHICYDNINRRSDEVLVVHNLPETDYASTDPNVMAYKLRTYVGKAVRFGDDYVGSLCVVYQDDFFPSEDDKKLIGIIASAIGVEENRRYAEETLLKEKRILEDVTRYANCGLLLLDTQGRFTYANRIAEEWFGHQIAGQSCRELYKLKDPEKECAALEAMRTGRVAHRNIVMQLPNGEEKFLNIVASPVKDSNGRIQQINEIVIDVSEHMKTEELRHETERLAYASRAKSDFLAIMSHELRTPLNAIIGFSELMKGNVAGELNAKQRRYADNIITSSKHLLALITDILDLSKVEAGKIELTIETISVPETINESLTLIKEKAAKHNVAIKKELDPALEFIDADKLRFKQILFNLLDNAVKFSKPEGGVVVVAAKKEGDMARISVSDTGIGIKEEDMGKLFSEFEQVSFGISRKYGGTGLGLSISKRLVELHGGRIWAESKFGEGSTFTFLLPIVAKGAGDLKNA